MLPSIIGGFIRLKRRVNYWDLFMQMYLVKFKDYSSVINCGCYHV